MVSFAYSPNDADFNRRHLDENLRFLNRYQTVSQPKLYGIPLWAYQYGIYIIYTVLCTIVALDPQSYLYLFPLLLVNVIMVPSFASISRILREFQVSFNDDVDNGWNDRFNRAVIIASARGLYPNSTDSPSLFTQITSSILPDSDAISQRHLRAIFLSILSIPSTLALQTMYDLSSLCVVFVMNHLIVFELISESISLIATSAATIRWKRVNETTDNSNDNLVLHNETDPVDDKIDLIQHLAEFCLDLTKRSLNISINMAIRWVEIILRPLVHLLGITNPLLAKNLHQSTVAHAMQPYPGVYLAPYIGNRDNADEKQGMRNTSTWQKLQYHQEFDPVDWQESQAP